MTDYADNNKYIDRYVLSGSITTGSNEILNLKFLSGRTHKTLLTMFILTDLLSRFGGRSARAIPAHPPDMAAKLVTSDVKAR